MAQEILVHDNYVGSDLTPLPPEINGDVGTIEIMQEVIDASAIDYLHAVMANQSGVLSVFPADFHVDPRDAIARVMMYLPLVEQRPKGANAFAQYLETIIKSTPANLGVPQVRVRLLLSNGSLRPSSLMSPGVATSVATLDINQRMMRSCLVPPVAAIPSLDELVVPAGAMVMCQQLPFLNQQTDLRKWGWDSPAGLYAERERALEVTKNVDGPEPESLLAKSSYSISTPASATVLGGLSNGSGVAEKVMSGENINPAEIAGAAGARGREMAAEFAESAEFSNPGVETAAEFGARQYAAHELPIGPPPGMAIPKAAAALAAGGFAAYEGFEKKREAQEKELQLTEQQHQEAEHNSKLAEQTAFKEQAPAPRPGRTPETPEPTQSSGLENAPKASTSEARTSEIDIENLATETAAAEAEVTSSGTPEPAMAAEPERPLSAPVPSIETPASAPVTERTTEAAAPSLPVEASFNEPANFATAESPGATAMAETRTTAPVTESGVEAAVPSLPVEVAPAARANAESSPTQTSAPETFASESPRSETTTLPESNSTSSESPAVRQEAALVEPSPTAEAAPSAAPPSEGSTAAEAPSLSRQEFPEARSLERQEGLTVKENNILPTSEGVRRDAEAAESNNSEPASAESSPFEGMEPTAEQASAPARSESPRESSDNVTSRVAAAEASPEPVREGPTRYDDLRAETSKTHEPSLEPQQSASNETSSPVAEPRSETQSSYYTTREDRQPQTAESQRSEMTSSEGPARYEDLRTETPSTTAPSVEPGHPSGHEAVESVGNTEDRQASVADTSATHQETQTHNPQQGPSNLQDGMETRVDAPATSHELNGKPEKVDTHPTGASGSEGSSRVYTDNLGNGPQPAPSDGSTSTQSAQDFAEQNFDMHHHFKHDIDDTPRSSSGSDSPNLHHAEYKPHSGDNADFGFHHHAVGGTQHDMHVVGGDLKTDPNDFTHLTGAESLWGQNGPPLHEAGNAMPFLATWLGIGANNQAPNASQKDQPRPAQDQRDRFSSSYKTRKTSAVPTDAMVMKAKLAEAKQDVKNGDSPHNIKNGAEKQMTEEETIVPSPQPPLPMPEPE